KAPADSNACRAACRRWSGSDMRLHPDWPTDRQAAEIGQIVLLEVACDPVADLAGGLWPQVIHSPKLDRPGAGQQKFQGVGGCHDPADADNRDAECSRQLPHRMQREWLDRRPTESTASPG